MTSLALAAGGGGGGRRLTGCVSPVPAGGSPSHVCRFCGVAFTKASHRARHERCVHLRQAEHECAVCHRAFSRQDNMRVHMKRVHGVVPGHGQPSLAAAEMLP